MKAIMIDALMDEMFKVAKHFADYGAEHAALFEEDKETFKDRFYAEFNDIRDRGLTENIAEIIDRFSEDEDEEEDEEE